MTRTHNTLSALATGLLAFGLASSSSNAQMAEPSTWTPGQPYVVAISDPQGNPLMVVAAGRIPLETEARVALFLPDLESFGDQEQQLTYTVLSQRNTLNGTMNKKSQAVVGRVHKQFIKAAGGAILGQPGSTKDKSQASLGVDSPTQKKSQEKVGRVHKNYIKGPAASMQGNSGGAQGGSYLLISSTGLQNTLGYSVDDDIVWIDSCVHGAYEIPGAGSMSTSEGVLSGTGAGAKNVSTSFGSAP
jgi:hypothetical protein